MSWDVLMIRTKTNSETLDEIKNEDIIPFRQTEIAGEIKKIAAELGAGYNCDDLSWQILDSNNWSIEFNIGKDAETVSVTLHIRGREEPKEVFAVLAADLSTRFIDGDTGEFISSGETTSFERWKAYRDQIVNGRTDQK